MRYLSLKYSRSDNLGDEIQSLAAEQFLPRLDGFVDRDTELHRVSEHSFVFMNGWFKHGPTHWRDDAGECWPPSTFVRPAFFGFHIAYPNALLTEDSVAYYRRWAPIGSRDRKTAEILQAAGVPAYFSRCLTLTFPRRSRVPREGRTFVVEGQHSVLRNAIPESMLARAEFRSHYIHPDLKGNNELKRQMAQALLDEYRDKATLVITDLLHCAMPCTALGIPVVFIANTHTLREDSHRLDPIRDLVPVYAAGDSVDWAPAEPDVSELADRIRTQARELVC